VSSVQQPDTYFIWKTKILGRQWCRFLLEEAEGKQNMLAAERLAMILLVDRKLAVVSMTLFG
jgi:hypothetical protein